MREERRGVKEDMARKREKDRVEALLEDFCLTDFILSYKSWLAR